MQAKTNLEILPVNGSHMVTRGGKEIARFNSIKQAEDFVLSSIFPKGN